MLLWPFRVLTSFCTPWTLLMIPPIYVNVSTVSSPSVSTPREMGVSFAELICITSILVLFICRPVFQAYLFSFVVFSCRRMCLVESKARSLAKSRSSRWFNSVHWITLIRLEVVFRMIPSMVVRKYWIDNTPFSYSRFNKETILLQTISS